MELDTIGIDLPQLFRTSAKWAAQENAASPVSPHQQAFGSMSSLIGPAYGAHYRQLRRKSPLKCPIFISMGGPKAHAQLGKYSVNAGIPVLDDLPAFRTFVAWPGWQSGFRASNVRIVDYMDMTCACRSSSACSLVREAFPRRGE
jgi:hypothetical protein